MCATDLEALKLQADQLQELCIEFGDLYTKFRQFRVENNITEDTKIHTLDEHLRMTHYLKFMQLAYKWRDICKIKYGKEYMHDKVPAIKKFTLRLEKELEEWKQEIKNG